MNAKQKALKMIEARSIRTFADLPGWTIQFKTVLGRWACYLGDCLIMSADTAEEAEQKVRDAMAKVQG